MAPESTSTEPATAANEPAAAGPRSRIARLAPRRLLALATALAVAFGLPGWAAEPPTEPGVEPVPELARLREAWDVAARCEEPATLGQEETHDETEEPASAPVEAPDPAAVRRPALAAAPFRSGELAVYEVRWGIFKAGSIELEVRPEAKLSGRPMWHFTGRARTSRLVRMFYRAEDTFDSLVDQRSFLPVGLHIAVDESGERGERSVFYDHEAGVAHYRKDRRFHRKHGPKLTCRKDSLAPRALDVFAALYRLRAVELESGSVFYLPVYDNGKSWEARFEVGERSTVDTGLGPVPAVALRVRSEIDGKLRSDKELEIWLSDDERRLMLRFEAALGWGRLKATLSGYRAAAGRELEGDLEIEPAD